VLPDLDTLAEELEKSDLIPFYAAIGCGAAGIMLSHTRYAALDPRRLASLSPAVAQSLLREKMGYAGLSITDDLEMGAVRSYCDTAAAAW
jgi:beta-N-acetylhexosaminidase